MITPVYNRTSSDCRMTAADMNRICSNVNEICGAALKTNWTSNDIVDAQTWETICDLTAALGRYSITYDTDYVNVNRIERSLFDQYEETHSITAEAKLTGLSISNGSLSPAFNPTTYSYTATVPDLTSVITASSDYSAIGYKVNGVVVDPAEVEWTNGANSLQITATLNGVTKTYTVIVTCSYQPASLTMLQVGYGPYITGPEYMTVTTSNAADRVLVWANGTVTLEMNGEVISGASVPWQFGTNIITITVTASDTKTYTLVVDCLYEAPIPAHVIAINISNSIMIPAFSSEKLSYEVYPETATATIEVIPEENVELAVYFNGAQIVNGSEIEWSPQFNDTITIVTKEGNGYSSVTYTVKAYDEIITEPLAPVRSGEIYAGEPIPGEPFE